jgi:hypothetical protein
MKLFFMPALLIFFAQASHATDFPVGTYDCVLQQAKLRFTVSRLAEGAFYIKLVKTYSGNEVDLEGGALRSEMRLQSGAVTRRIALPGTTFEAFFDESGHVGLSENILDCQKI